MPEKPMARVDVVKVKIGERFELDWHDEVKTVTEGEKGTVWLTIVRRAV